MLGRKEGEGVDGGELWGVEKAVCVLSEFFYPEMLSPWLVDAEEPRF